MTVLFTLSLIEFAKKAVSKSPGTGTLFLSITPILSPSPSNAIPKSALASFIFWDRVSSVETSVGSG